MVAVEWSVEDPGGGVAAALIEAMIDELTGMYGRIDGPGTPSATPADLSPPGGAYLVGRVGAAPVAGGGIKRLAPDTAEIKRMYVVPAWRGRGVSHQLLARLEAHAVELGYARVRLDTGVHQDRARSLYERSGYRTIDDYNANPLAAYWGEKDLA